MHPGRSVLTPSLTRGYVIRVHIVSASNASRSINDDGTAVLDDDDLVRLGVCLFGIREGNLGDFLEVIARSAWALGRRRVISESGSIKRALAVCEAVAVSRGWMRGLLLGLDRDLDLALVG